MIKKFICIDKRTNLYTYDIYTEMKNNMQLTIVSTITIKPTKSPLLDDWQSRCTTTLLSVWSLTSSKAWLLHWVVATTPSSVSVLHIPMFCHIKYHMLTGSTTPCIWHRHSLSCLSSRPRTILVHDTVA